MEENTDATLDSGHRNYPPPFILETHAHAYFSTYCSLAFTYLQPSFIMYPLDTGSGLNTAVLIVVLLTLSGIAAWVIWMFGTGRWGSAKVINTLQPG